MRRAALGAACLVLSTCRGGPEAPARPNVLLVTLDTTRADHLGAYGAARASTPAFDRIAREGVLFENAWTTAPLTTPAHASILTGLYPPAHRVHNNGRVRLADEVTTLAEALSREGYATGAFVAAFTVSRPFGLAQGFDRFDDDFGTDERGRPRSERRADQVNARALPWVAEAAAGKRPFFAWIHYYDAHDPYDPPSPFAETFRGRPYDGEIAYADSALGRVLDALGDASVLDTTIVVVCGDHGEALGEHGEPTHGLLVYEPTLHVPLAIRAPWRSEAHGRSEEPVSVVDVAPTVAALAHVDLGNPRDGTNLFAPSSRAIYAESRFAADEFGWAVLAAVRRGPSKWIAAPRSERYDLAADPRELRDLAGRDAATDASMTEDLAELLRESEARRSRETGAALDDEMLARLQSLGYVGGGGSGAPSSGGGTARDPKDGVRDYLDYLHGTEAISAGDDATPLFQRLVAADPSNPEFRLRLGQALRAGGNLRAAEAAYRELIHRYPDYYLAYRRLASLLASEGRAAESRDLWLALKARGSEYVGVDARLAEAYLANDQGERALAAAEAGLQRWPHDAELIVLAARAQERLGHDDRALAGYREALDQRPSDLQALDGALALLKRLGRAPQARELAEECVRRSAGDRAVKSRLAGI